ncbi:putative DNA-binding transcriptional regulator YafY [Deinobacterium chartae]|uniref:Putative DNA-binding transcriptional regulator YafY n=1 Tax=Deinobacterium chartae TaxID=521158 RepID=A0A841HVF1_9DEIO|nr:YafY family protein [Deinobacterium chartae]MBB6096803.1 putative DNA-binding transcriptional regulator YafY [Deinobacterium chartae]
MYDPSMRVLTVLEILQTRERISGRELAARLEVNVRTVQRYIARLQDLGVPVESIRGPGGAYRLRPGFRLPPMMFGTEEALALVLGLDALSHLGLAQIAPATSGVRAKLERVLPAAVSEQVRALRAALELDAPQWTAPTDVALVTTLALAVHARRRVRLNYRARGQAESLRTVEPLGLLQYEGRWLLAARCLLRGDLRSFRVDRVHTAEMLNENFEPPVNFRLREYLYRSLAFAPEGWQVEVWLDAPISKLEYFLPRGRALLEPEGDGTRLRCGASDLEGFAARLLQIGCRLEVRRPTELITAFEALSRRALEVAASAAVST